MVPFYSITCLENKSNTSIYNLGCDIRLHKMLLDFFIIISIIYTHILSQYILLNVLKSMSNSIAYGAFLFHNMS